MRGYLKNYFFFLIYYWCADEWNWIEPSVLLLVLVGPMTRGWLLSAARRYLMSVWCNPLRRDLLPYWVFAAGTSCLLHLDFWFTALIHCFTKDNTFIKRSLTCAFNGGCSRTTTYLDLNIWVLNINTLWCWWWDCMAVAVGHINKAIALR
jgi:hypothetical protein